MRPVLSLLLLWAGTMPVMARRAGSATTLALPAESTTAPVAWSASWATSVMGAEPGQPGVAASRETDATIRQIVHLSLGGNKVRVQFSNAFGTQPLLLDAASVGLATAAGSSRVIAGSNRSLLFAGRPAALIPVGATFLSDPVALKTVSGSSLAVSMHLPYPPAGESAHPGSRATSYLLPGNHVNDTELSGAEEIVRWMQLAEVDVAGATSRTVVGLGDSITDGHGAGTDANQRWTDALAARLASSGRQGVAVVNEGIGGNHLLTNGLGQSALERFDRDVLAVAGVQAVIVLEGINDLGGLARNPEVTPQMRSELVQRMESAYTQIIARAHAHGLAVYGATLTPDGGSDYYHPNTEDDAARMAVNTWIRQPGHFDGAVDLDRLLRDPAQPSRLLPAFDSGDHLHPGPAGYKAIGEAIPLQWFR